MPLILLAACTHRAGEEKFVFSFENSSKPSVAVEPVEDAACNFSSAKVAQSLSTSILERMEQKEVFAVEKTGQFLVQMQLIELEQTDGKPPELSMSVHVKISNRASGKIILQEVVMASTLLESGKQSAKENRISPMGLAIAKLSREITQRIEDYILLGAS